MTHGEFNVLSLFSGIGGIDLGLERAGMRVVAQCERDEFARAVLRHHWPDVPCYDDVATLTAERLRADGIVPDFIAGGFPCQDISYAGRGAGLAGTRSGLWWEFHRLIAEIRPRGVLIENVDALRRRGLGAILRSLADLGYDAEWHRISAADVGAPHLRRRIWIVAYTAGLLRLPIFGGEPDGACELLAHADREGQSGQPVDGEVGGFGGALGDARRPICGRNGRRIHSEKEASSGARRINGRESDGPANASEGVGLADADQPRLEGLGRLLERAREQSAWQDGEAIEGGRIVKPGLRLLAHGVSRRVDQLRCYGNAVVPQIPEIIGRAIIEAARVRP